MSDDQYSQCVPYLRNLHQLQQRSQYITARPVLSLEHLVDQRKAMHVGKLLSIDKSHVRKARRVTIANLVS